jgi:hypothetical protein
MFSSLRDKFNFHQLPAVNLKHTTPQLSINVALFFPQLQSIRAGQSKNWKMGIKTQQFGKGKQRNTPPNFMGSSGEYGDTIPINTN